MKNKYRILKIALVLGLLGFLLAFSLDRFAHQKIKQVHIAFKQKQLVYFVNEYDVKADLKKINPNKIIGQMEVPLLEKQLNKNHWVDSANVYLQLNGDLHIDVYQKMPILRLKRAKKDLYLDEQGKSFPVSDVFTQNCLMVEGKIKPEEYPDLIALAKNLAQDAFMKHYVVGISKTATNHYELLTNGGAFKIELGPLEHQDLKLKGFKSFVEKILVHQDQSLYEKISLRYENQIVTTLRNKNQIGTKIATDTITKKQ
jgi:cell division protein FtsQ